MTLVSTFIQKRLKLIFSKFFQCEYIQKHIWHCHKVHQGQPCHALIPKILSGGGSIFFFKLMRGERIKITLKVAIIGQPGKCHWNGVWLASNEAPTCNAGLVILWLFMGSLYFCDFFRGGGSGPPVPPSGSVHAYITSQTYILKLTSTILHTKAQGQRLFGSRDDFFQVFTLYRHGSHFCHVT